MSTNCIRCVENRRTGPDLLCDRCRQREIAVAGDDFDPFKVTPIVGKWYFELYQSWKPAGAYDTAEEAEAAGRKFAKSQRSLAVLCVGQWQRAVAKGPAVKTFSLRNEKVEINHA